MQIKPKKKEINLYANDMITWDHEGKTYVLRVETDDLIGDPRLEEDAHVARLCLDYDNYRLGDYQGENKKSLPQFLSETIRECVPVDVLAEQLRGGAVPEWSVEDDGSAEDFLDALEADEIGSPLAAAAKLCKDYAVILPVWLYDHSGITISAGPRVYPYNDRWDSGCAGCAVLTKADALANLAEYLTDEDGQPKKVCDAAGNWHYHAVKANDGNWKRLAEKHILAEVEAYDQYLTGDIYWYELLERPAGVGALPSEADDWDECDSCGGFYGSDILANGMAEQAGHGLEEALASGNYRPGRCEPYTVLKHRFKFD